jgi:class 3 adenylate cyclase
MRLRIGINLGEVIVDGDDLYGDGVNVAARLEAIAPVGGVAISGSACEQVRGPHPRALRGCRAAVAQEHRRAGAHVSRARGGGRRAASQ